jgi:hypothetical protein
MTAYTNVGRHDSAASPSESFSGALLTAGAGALFAGALFYARFQPALSLPALPAERGQALADAMSLGPQRLALAGSLAFTGNCLLLAASIALACRRRGQSDLETAGWSLIALTAALPVVFDSPTAAVLWPLAQGSDPAPFLAFKSWFDFLFAAGYVPFGIGLAAVLWAERRARSPRADLLTAR